MARRAATFLMTWPAHTLSSAWDTKLENTRGKKKANPDADLLERNVRVLAQTELKPLQLQGEA